MFAFRSEPQTGRLGPVFAQFLMNAPLRKSLSAWRIWSCVFITIGPCQATGSRGSAGDEEEAHALVACLDDDLVAAPNTTSDRLPTLSRTRTSSPSTSASRSTPNGSDASANVAEPSKM